MARPLPILLALFALSPACAPYGKADYAREHDLDGCLHGCAEGEMCNFGYAGDPCLPKHSSKLGEPCSVRDNCADGLDCDTRAMPGRCAAASR
jgi:hypothetical protein